MHDVSDISLPDQLLCDPRGPHWTQLWSENSGASVEAGMAHASSLTCQDEYQAVGSDHDGEWKQRQEKKAWRTKVWLRRHRVRPHFGGI